MGNTYKIENHTIEFKDGSSTLNPWSFEYCSQIGLGLMCTADLTPYMRVDGEKIYHLRRHCGKHHDLKDALESPAVVVTWEDAQTIFEELFEDFVGNFSEMKVRLDEAKREEDEFKNGVDSVEVVCVSMTCVNENMSDAAERKVRINMRNRNNSWINIFLHEAPDELIDFIHKNIH